MRRNGVKSHLAKIDKSRRTSENGIREIRFTFLASEAATTKTDYGP
jgi:hypothetical protein